jgi:hypothetical protein
MAGGYIHLCRFSCWDLDVHAVYDVKLQDSEFAVTLRHHTSTFVQLSWFSYWMHYGMIDYA